MIQNKPIDFTNCPDGHRKYGGSDGKDSIIYNNEPYMIKYTEIRKPENDFQSSHVNNVFSEYIGSHIVSSLGIKTHETLLGEYKGNLVVACKDFRKGDEELHEFTWYMLNMYDSSQIGRIPTYNQLYDVLNNNQKLGPIREKAINRYWETFVADALIGNFDRHKDNFGYLVSLSSGKIRLAPVYDCGSSIYPGLSSDGMHKVLNNENEILRRMYEFPKAALNKSDDIKKEDKFGYYELLSSNMDFNCTKAFLNVYPRINMDKINEIIDAAPYIPTEKKDFYKQILGYRKNLILDKAYKHLIKQIDKNKSDVRPSMHKALFNSVNSVNESKETDCINKKKTHEDLS